MSTLLRRPEGGFGVQRIVRNEGVCFGLLTTLWLVAKKKERSIDLTNAPGCTDLKRISI